MNSGKLGWKGLAEIFGTLGVIGSLIFVALEIRQNTNAVRSATIHAIAEMSYDTSMRMAENPELLAIQRAADNGEPLTIGQRDQLVSFYSGIMRIQQDRFQQYQLGILDEETVFQVGGRGRGYRSLFFAEFWEERKETYPVEFRQFMEREILPLSAGFEDPRSTRE